VAAARPESKWRAAVTIVVELDRVTVHVSLARHDWE
jgi:hypothetical protein